MTDKSPSELPAVRFVVPQSLQTFPLFQQLPYDVRFLIWTNAIFTPGIHFLQFVDEPTFRAHASAEAHSGGSAVAQSERRAEGTQDTQGLVYSATLKPLFYHSCADNSHYITTGKTLARLRATCKEVSYMVDRVLAQPGNLTLDNGQLVMLQRSSDVLCVDYPNMNHARSLGRWADNLDLDQLAKVRRLAIRYHHEWDNYLICTFCGRVHSYHGNHPSPRHVYEFAALFKNLETFYFIDYLTVRSPPRPPNYIRSTDFDGPHERFASGDGGRCYFEIDPEHCTTHTRVYETLAWVKHNYYAHCICKGKGPLDPGKVRFRILGCEWEEKDKLVPLKCLSGGHTSMKKARTKSRSQNSELAISSPKSSANSGESLPQRPQPTATSALPVVFGDGGKSKFEFTMEVPH